MYRVTYLDDWNFNHVVKWSVTFESYERAVNFYASLPDCIDAKLEEVEK